MIHSISLKLLLNLLFYRKPAEDDDDEEDEEEEQAEVTEDHKTSAEREQEEANRAAAQKLADEEAEARNRNQELIRMQMKAQEELIQAKKEAAALATAAEVASAEGKINVMDIQVEDNFDIDDI